MTRRVENKSFLERTFPKLAALAATAALASACGQPYEEDRVVVEGKEYLVSLHPTGAIPNTNDPAPNASVTNITLPASVDLTSRVPTPGDQGQQGSCVGWAVAYASKSALEGNEEGWALDTTFHQFSPAFIYNQINGGKDNGSNFGTAMNLVTNSGCDTLSSTPYDDTDFTTQPSAAAKTRAAHFKDSSWNVVKVDEVSLKTALYKSNAPLVVGISVLPDFDALDATNDTYNTDQGTRSTCATAPCSRGYHAIALIGYNDTKKAFRFINSWGTGWGDGGYGWIAYSFINNANLNMVAYQMNDAANTPIDEFHASLGGKSKWTGIALRTNPSGSSTLLTMNDLLVGNFDNVPGKDLFATSGGAWYVSSSGYGPWKKINTSSAVAADLIAADFNGDGKSDIMYADGSEWRVSYSGTGSWTHLNSSGYDKSRLKVGDFNGDGKDDVLRSASGIWYVAWGGAGGWVAINNVGTGYAFSDMKVAELDGKPGKDMLYTDGTYWYYSANASGAFVQINKSGFTASDLLIGNFDGTGSDDIVSSYGGKWHVAYNGRGGWQDLASSGVLPTDMLVLNVDGGTDDLIAK